MSGFEVAGIVLGAIPLIISVLENWRIVSKVSRTWRDVRRQQMQCLRDVQLYQIIYRRNLKELLLPIVRHPDDVDWLIRNPGNDDWRDPALAARLESRLDEAHPAYMAVIQDMNQALKELQEEIGVHNVYVQRYLSKMKGDAAVHDESVDASLESLKDKVRFAMFRAGFSLSESKRKDLFDRLNESNNRLEKLLSSSDRLTCLQGVVPRTHRKKSVHALENVLEQAGENSKLLFEAIQRAWRCSCQRHHVANLRVEHRTAAPPICHEIILASAPGLSAPTQASGKWSWKELWCGDAVECAVSTSSPPVSDPLHQNPPRVDRDTSFTSSIDDRLVRGPENGYKQVQRPVPSNKVLKPPTDRNIKLCRQLRDPSERECMGIISRKGETWHLHPIEKKSPSHDPITLDYVLSNDFTGPLSRRQRYHMALQLASAQVQLQGPGWLNRSLTKMDVMFFASRMEDEGRHVLNEPFVRQVFSASSESDGQPKSSRNRNFHSLGILLLELCFGTRLEDLSHYCELRALAGDGILKEWLDVGVAVNWAKEVEDEAGEEFARAVKWCFTGESAVGGSWRSGIVRNVIQPLESCQKYFGIVA